jgi:hypothetical protein
MAKVAVRVVSGAAPSMGGRLASEAEAGLTECIQFVWVPTRIMVMPMSPLEILLIAIAIISGLLAHVRLRGERALDTLS